MIKIKKNFTAPPATFENKWIENEKFKRTALHFSKPKIEFRKSWRIQNTLHTHMHGMACPFSAIPLKFGKDFNVWRFFLLSYSLNCIRSEPKSNGSKKRKNNFLLVCQLLRIDTNGIACMSVYTQWNTTHNSDTHRNKKKNFFCPSSLSSIFFISNIRCNTKEETRKNRTKLIKKKKNLKNNIENERKILFFYYNFFFQFQSVSFLFFEVFNLFEMVEEWNREKERKKKKSLKADFATVFFASVLTQKYF